MRIPVIPQPLDPGDPRAWLAREALARPADAPPHVVVAGTADARLDTGPPAGEDLGATDAALLDDAGVEWVGGHGVTVLQAEGRPALVTYARLRRRDGRAWCRVWARLPGMPADPEGGRDHAGPLADLPGWLRPLFPPLRAGAAELATQAASAPAAGPLPAPDLTLDLPEGAAFPDAVHAAAHRLEARFVSLGRAEPTLVVWRADGLAAWVGAGREAAGRLHGWGRRLGADPSVRALGMFGLGEDEVDGRRVPMIALAMQARGRGSVLWLRRFQRVSDGRARWLDPVGLIRSPGPNLGLF